MMKVQKPLPKTLAKQGGKVESVIKKKKSAKMPGRAQLKMAVDAQAPPKLARSKRAKQLVEPSAAAVKPGGKEKPAKGGGKSLKKQLEHSAKSERKAKVAPSLPVAAKKAQDAAGKPTAKKAKGANAAEKAPKPMPSAASAGKMKKKKQSVKNAMDAKNATLKNAMATPPTTTTTTTNTTTTADAIVKKKKKKAAKQAEPTKKAAAAAAVGGAASASSSSPLTKLQKKKAIKRAFKRQQLKNKIAGKEKRVKAPPSRQYEAPAFDADKFDAIVNVENIKKVAAALKVQVEGEVKVKRNSIFSDYRYFLNVSSFKIANCPKRMVKLNLKHSLISKDDDAVIVVADMQRGAKVDYEPTIQHYEDVFREAGIEGLKIMPFNQLRNECNTFETVRKFGNTYDYFLCDGRIVGMVVGFCGKIFQKPRTTFHAVRFDNPKNLKMEIEKSLRRTAFKQLAKGDLISIPVGTDKFTAEQLAENVEHVVAQLKTIYPGGLANVRSMNLKIDLVGTSSLPIYLSMGQAPPETPNVIGPREQRLLKLKKDANAVLSKFNLTKDAKIIKMTKDQVERKLKFRETRATLLAEKFKNKGDDMDEDDDNDDDEDDDEEDEDNENAKKPMDDDGEESTVPAKKSRKEDTEKTDVDGEVAKKTVEKNETQQDDKDADNLNEEDGDSVDEDEEDPDDDDDDDDGDDDEDVDDEDDDEVDAAQDDDDDDDDEDDDDEDGDGDGDADDDEDSD